MIIELDTSLVSRVTIYRYPPPVQIDENVTEKITELAGLLGDAVKAENITAFIEAELRTSHFGYEEVLAKDWPSLKISDIKNIKVRLSPLFKSEDGYIRISDGEPFSIHSYAKSSSETDEEFVKFLKNNGLAFSEMYDSGGDHHMVVEVVAGSDMDSLLALRGCLFTKVYGRMPASEFVKFLPQEASNLITRLGIKFPDTFQW